MHDLLSELGHQRSLSRDAPLRLLAERGAARHLREPEEMLRQLTVYSGATAVLLRRFSPQRDQAAQRAISSHS